MTPVLRALAWDSCTLAAHIPEASLPLVFVNIHLIVANKKLKLFFQWQMLIQSSKEFHFLSPGYFTYSFFFKYKQSSKRTQFPYLSQHHLCGSTGRWVLMTIPVAAQTEGWRKGRTIFWKALLQESWGQKETPAHPHTMLQTQKGTQNHAGWKGPTRPWSPTVPPATTDPCPQVPHPHSCKIPPGMRSPPLPWEPWSNLWVKKFLLKSNLNLNMRLRHGATRSSEKCPCSQQEGWFRWILEDSLQLKPFCSSINTKTFQTYCQSNPLSSNYECGETGSTRQIFHC